MPSLPKHILKKLRAAEFASRVANLDDIDRDIVVREIARLNNIPVKPMPKQPIVRIVPFKRFSASRKHLYHYFRLVADNAEIVGQSESYETAAARSKTMRLLAGAKLVVAK